MPVPSAVITPPPAPEAAGASPAPRAVSAAPTRIVFVGPPGSGKGTQAARLVADGFVHGASGDMLRAEISAGTPLGLAVEEVVRDGGLVADELLDQLVGNFLARHADSPVVLDGYPRTLVQARHLAQRCTLDAAVFFILSDEVVLRRLGDRVMGADGVIYDLLQYPPPEGMTWIRREDDHPDVQRRRLAAYRQREAELRDFYTAANLYRPVDASLDVEQVYARLRSALTRSTAA